MANYLKLNKSYIGNDILENPEFNMLGPDIITNGNFETDSNWSTDDGWLIYGGKAVCDGTSGNLEQASILTIGKIYTVTITISDYVSGSVQVSVGAGPRDIFTANGTYTVTQTAQPNSSFFIVSSSFEGAVESVIVQESGQIEFVDNGAFYGVADDTDVTTLTGWSVASASYPATSTNVACSGCKLVIVSGGIYEGAGYDLTGIPNGMEVNLKIESVTGDIGNGALYLNGTGIDIPTDSGSVDYTFIKEASNTKLLFRAGFNTAGTTNYENISIQPTNVFAYGWQRNPNEAQEGVTFSNNNVTMAGQFTKIKGLSSSYPSGTEVLLKFDVLSFTEGVNFRVSKGAGEIEIKDLKLGENELRYTTTASQTDVIISTSNDSDDYEITLDSMSVQEVKNQPKLIGVDNVSTVSAPTNSTVVINNGLTDGADTITITYAEADASSTVQMRNFFQDAIVESANANNTGKVIEIKSPVLINDIVAS